MPVTEETKIKINILFVFSGNKLVPEVFDFHFDGGIVLLFAAVSVWPSMLRLTGVLGPPRLAAMSHPIQPLPARHEVDLQARRFERKTEDFRLAKLKAAAACEGASAKTTAVPNAPRFIRYL